MYPLQGSEKERMARRKTYRPSKGGQFGSLADFETAMINEGFSFQLPKGRADTWDMGKLRYKHPTGKTAILKRVERGEPARFTGATVGLVRTAAQPDVWQLLRGQSRRKN